MHVHTHAHMHVHTHTHTHTHKLPSPISNIYIWHLYIHSKATQGYSAHNTVLNRGIVAIAVPCHLTSYMYQTTTTRTALAALWSQYRYDMLRLTESSLLVRAVRASGRVFPGRNRVFVSEVRVHLRRLARVVCS